MMETKENNLKRAMFFSTALFAVFTVWLLYLVFSGQGPDSHAAQIWASSYQLIAWFGAICGLYFASLWGGFKSRMGRVNLGFAIGLLLQSFGQSVFSFYYFNGIEVPYPSLADLGFFGSIPFYIYSIYVLGKVSGASLSFKLYSKKIIAVVIPVAILALSYLFFLKGYEYDWAQPLVVLLDFGYPFGQAIYIALAIVAYLLVKDYLGGFMRKAVILFMVALAVQFIADYVFLYQVSRDVYVGGLEVDFLYMLAYFIMTYSLLKLSYTFYQVQKS